MQRKSIPRGSGKRVVQARDLRLADEVRYIQSRAADRDARIVTIGPLVLFSTQTGDAWLLDPADHLALPLTRDGDPQPAQIEDTDTAFAIGWTGQYHIDGPAFVYLDQRNGRVATILGYSTQKLTQKART
jgi:hypothetical protein